MEHIASYKLSLSPESTSIPTPNYSRRADLQEPNTPALSSFQLASVLSKRIEQIDQYYRKEWSKRANQGPLKMAARSVQSNEELFCFPDPEQPSSDPRFFIQLLVEGGQFTPETLLVGYILLERFLELSGIRRPLDFCDLYAVAVLVANKYLQETERWALEEYALLSEMPKENIATLEQKFLSTIDYRVLVCPKQYSAYLKVLRKEL